MASFSEVAGAVSVAIGAGVALLGAPNIFLGIKKSQVEIRKLELEAAKLQADGQDPASLQGPDQSLRVNVEGAGNVVKISTDLRLLGPLLLLLDFVCATIILTVAGYLLSFGGLSILSPLLAAVGVVLFVPIFREARRLKRTLTPSQDD